jgi:ribonucleoside-diphosphate reductase alpha chain
VRIAIRQLDRVSDLNYYPITSTQDSNRRWRNVGLGVMGLQDVFFQLRLPFDAPAAREISRRIQEEIYYSALNASAELAVERGPHPAFAETRAKRGEFQFEMWNVAPTDQPRWEELRGRIRRHGLRNSLMIAIRTVSRSFA